jgi:hypothetical protein
MAAWWKTKKTKIGDRVFWSEVVGRGNEYKKRIRSGRVSKTRGDLLVIVCRDGKKKTVHELRCQPVEA